MPAAPPNISISKPVQNTIGFQSSKCIFYSFLEITHLGQGYLITFPSKFTSKRKRQTLDRKKKRKHYWPLSEIWVLFIQRSTDILTSHSCLNDLSSQFHDHFYGSQNHKVALQRRHQRWTRRFRLLELVTTSFPGNYQLVILRSNKCICCQIQIE